MLLDFIVSEFTKEPSATATGASLQLNTERGEFFSVGFVSSVTFETIISYYFRSGSDWNAFQILSLRIQGVAEAVAEEVEGEHR